MPDRRVMVMSHSDGAPHQCGSLRADYTRTCVCKHLRRAVEKTPKKKTAKKKNEEEEEEGGEKEIQQHCVQQLSKTWIAVAK